MKARALVLRAWQWLRRASGDDAYERYLRHVLERHPDDPPLDRKAFFKREQRQKWEGVRRCC